MRMLSLLGGLRPEDLDYYLEYFHRKLDDMSFLDVCLLFHTEDHDHMQYLADTSNWSAIGDICINTARLHQDLGSEGVILCSDVLHLAADRIQDAVDIPLLDFRDSFEILIQDRGIQQVCFRSEGKEQQWYRKLFEHRGSFSMMFTQVIPRDSVRYRFIPDSGIEAAESSCQVIEGAALHIESAVEFLMKDPHDQS